MSTRLLAIESATDWLSIALLEDDAIVLSRESSETRQHASALMPLIQAGLAEVDWSVSTLDALAVSAGPGSFTSLRIGLATAKGLAFGRDVRAVGVSTLEVMAAGVEGSSVSAEHQIIALLDARRGEWYAGGYFASSSSGASSPGLAEGLYDPDAMGKDLAEPVILCCPEPGEWWEGFESAGLRIAARIEGEAARPRATHVGRLGAAALARGEDVPADELVARYLRRAEAEAKRLGGPVEAGELSRVSAS
jgi:tRNA threonylcarbamoyladenosine biosynthesis protein TsaB